MDTLLTRMKKRNNKLSGKAGKPDTEARQS